MIFFGSDGSNVMFKFAFDSFNFLTEAGERRFFAGFAAAVIGLYAFRGDLFWDYYLSGDLLGTSEPNVDGRFLVGENVPVFVLRASFGLI